MNDIYAIRFRANTQKKCGFWKRLVAGSPKFENRKLTDVCEILHVPKICRFLRQIENLLIFAKI